MDIIKILKISSENENIKFANPTLGLLGLIGIPAGFILFNICESRNDFFGQISILFLGCSLICLYFLTSEITAIGSFFKEHATRIYRKNLFFFNLVRQKGRQYTLALFVSTILIAVAIFGIGFIGAGFLEGYYQIKEDPYDFSLLTSFEQEKIDREEIERFAGRHEIKLQSFVELDVLLIGREFQYDYNTTEWSGQYVTSASSFQSLGQTSIQVPIGSCLFYVNMSDGPSLGTILDDKALFYNPTTKQEFSLPIKDKIIGTSLMNKSGAIYDLFVLNDSDYKQLKDSVNHRYQLKYYLFNASDATSAVAFHEELLQEVVEASGGRILDNFFDSPVRELMIAEGKKVSADDYYINYKGNELYAGRWWSMYPFARECALEFQLETGAVYFLIMIFIAVIAFVSAVMVIGLKILGTIWQDEESYQKAVNYPTILGCILGVIMINQIILASSATHVGPVTAIAVILAMVIIVIQVLIYFVLKRNIMTRFNAEKKIS